MKLVGSLVLLALAVSSCSNAAPQQPISAGSDLTYLHIHTGCLSSDSCNSRRRRQDDGDGDSGSSFRKLLLEVRQVAAATLTNYGCPFDASGNEFTQKFLTAYSVVVPNVDPDEKLIISARKIIAKLVTDYKCVGRVEWTDPTFEDKFKAAYAREILESGDGPDTTRNIAALIMSSKYNCGKINPNSKEFIEKFLSVFVDVVDRAKIRTKEPDYDPEGTDLTRWHIAQLIKKYGCGNPDYDSDEFKTNYFIGYATLALS